MSANIFSDKECKECLKEANAADYKRHVKNISFISTMRYTRLIVMQV